MTRACAWLDDARANGATVAVCGRVGDGLGREPFAELTIVTGVTANIHVWRFAEAIEVGIVGAFSRASPPCPRAYRHLFKI